MKNLTYESRPCGFGQSLGRPIVRSFSHFFWSTKKNLSSLREFLVSLWEFLVNQISFWYTKIFFGRQNFFWSTKNSQRLTKNSLRLDNFFWSTKKNEKKTGQLVDQETDQNHMDGTNISLTRAFPSGFRFQ